jgi:predicted ribosome quality control (RQC) complex YloA/Tae2 family protein
MERARARLPARIETAEREAERWRRLVEGVRAGRVPPDELAREVRPPGAARTRQKTGSRPASSPYRRLTSSGGLEIRIGRSARQNDELTFRHSAPDDIWLHARQAAGAHVILRWGREGNPPRRDLVEAATLAALHSEARHSGSVAITWTRRKHVRKPRKSPAGSVVAERAQTLIVEPDPGLLERLAVEAEGG